MYKGYSLYICENAKNYGQSLADKCSAIKQSGDGDDCTIIREYLHIKFICTKPTGGTKIVKFSVLLMLLSLWYTSSTLLLNRCALKKVLLLVLGGIPVFLAQYGINVTPVLI